MRRHRPPPPRPEAPPPLQQVTSDQGGPPSQFKHWTPQRLLSSSYKDLGTPSNVASHFQKCLLTSHKTLTSLLSILLNEPGKTGISDYSLQVDIHDFISMDPVLGNIFQKKLSLFK